MFYGGEHLDVRETVWMGFIACRLNLLQRLVNSFVLDGIFKISFIVRLVWMAREESCLFYSESPVNNFVVDTEGSSGITKDYLQVNSKLVAF